MHRRNEHGCDSEISGGEVETGTVDTAVHAGARELGWMLIAIYDELKKMNKEE